MHLAERGAHHRGDLKGLEGLGDTGPDFDGDSLLDGVEGDRFDILLQAGQGVEADRWEQIGASRQELTQLDERGPSRLEIIDELLGVLVGGGAVARRVSGVEVL